MRTLKNIVYQLINLAGSKVLMYLFIIVLARLVSVEDFGRYNFITLYAALWTVLMDFGFEPYIIKQVASGEDKSKVFCNNIFLKIIFLLSGFLGLVLLAPLFTVSELLMAVIVGVAFGTDSLSRFMFSFMRGAQDLRYEAIFTFVQKLFFVGTGIVILWIAPSLTTIFWVMALVNFLFCVLVFLFTIKRYSITPRFLVQVKDIGKKISLLAPFFVISIFTVIYFKIDVFMLRYLGNDYMVGIYSAAFRLMEAFQMIPAAIIAALFPGLVAAYLESREKFMDLFKKILAVLISAGFLVITFGWLFGEQIITLLYGEKYTDSIQVFYVLISAIFPMYINYLLTQTLIAVNKQKFYSLWVMICAFVNAALNLFMIPEYGALGAAIATIVTEMVLLVLIIPLLKEQLKAADWGFNILTVILWIIIFLVCMVLTGINVLMAFIGYAILSFIPAGILIRKYFPQLTPRRGKHFL